MSDLSDLLERWPVAPLHPQHVSLAASLHLSPLTAQVLANRGVYSVEQASRFLHGNLDDLLDPLMIPGMERAVAALQRALEQRRRICVYGDYDCDGVTATALITGFLKRLGCQAEFYVPLREEEGYGLNMAAVEGLAARGIELLLTVDCGSANHQEVARARELGLEVLVTDHHELPAELPAATALVNPKLDSAKAAGELAGVGVAWKLACALDRALGGRGQASADLRSYLDLVALGTVADMVPLLGDNRLLVKAGLGVLAGSSRAGLQALLQVAGTRDKQPDVRTISYLLAPRLNAAGRLGSASPAVRLLLAEYLQEAMELAGGLEEANKRRRILEESILAEALCQVKENPSLAEQAVVVLESPLWHPGVIGTVASKLAQTFRRPAVLIATRGDLGTGSARSFSNIDLLDKLNLCSHLLVKFGGHRLAAGLTISSSKVEIFRQRLCQELEPLSKTAITSLKADAEAFFTQLDQELASELELLSPFGSGNPEPVFVTRGCRVAAARPVGKNGHHLRLQLESDGGSLAAVGFNLAQQAGRSWPPVLPEAAQPQAGYEQPLQIDIAYSLRLNSWQGHSELELVINDFVATLEPGPAPEQPEVPGGPVLLQEATAEVAATVAETKPGMTVPGTTGSCRFPFQVIDWRGYPPDTILGKLGTELKVLVIVRSSRQAIKLARFWRGSDPEFRHQTLFYHQQLTSNQQDNIRELIAVGGLTRLVVSGWPAPWLAALSRKLVFLDPPHSAEFLEKWLQFSASQVTDPAVLEPGNGGTVLTAPAPDSTGLQVCLAYNESQVRHWGTWLSRHFPDTNSLRRVYRLFTAAAGPSKFASLPVTDYRSILRQAGLLSEDATLARVLRIFHELGLMGSKARGGELELIVFNHPAKVNLSDSTTFQLGQQRLAAWQALAKRLLGPVEELVR